MGVKQFTILRQAQYKFAIGDIGTLIIGRAERAEVRMFGALHD